MKGCIDKMVVSAKHALCYVALHCQEVGRVALVKMNGVISTVRCSILHPTWIPSNPIHSVRPLLAPRCYICLYDVLLAAERDGDGSGC